MPRKNKRKSSKTKCSGLRIWQEASGTVRENGERSWRKTVSLELKACLRRRKTQLNKRPVDE